MYFLKLFLIAYGNCNINMMHLVEKSSKPVSADEFGINKESD